MQSPYGATSNYMKEYVILLAAIAISAVACVPQSELDSAKAESAAAKAEVAAAKAELAELKNRSKSAEAKNTSCEERLRNVKPCPAPEAAPASDDSEAPNLLLSRLGDVVSGKGNLPPPVPISQQEPFNIFSLGSVEETAITFHRDKRNQGAWKFFLEPKGDVGDQKFGNAVIICSPKDFGNTFYRISNGPLSGAVMMIMNSKPPMVTIASRPFIDKHLLGWRGCLKMARL